MRILIFTIAITFYTLPLFAQSESAAYRKVSDRFGQLYNQEKYDSIFAMYNRDMQKFLPSKKSRAFYEDVMSSYGQIRSRQFMKMTENGFAMYKTIYDHGVSALNIAVDGDGHISGLSVTQYIDQSTPDMQRNITKMQLPFHGEWTVFWGGDTKTQNMHVSVPAQKNAFDILVTDADGHTHRSDGKVNEDYYAFGKEIISPCNGEVVEAVDGVKDNKPGSMNPIYTPGNSIMIRTANNEYILIAHLKQNSVKVKQGQKLVHGDVIGLCGNSGNSSEPHLHFHIENIEDMNTATGIKCYFDRIKVNGQIKTDYSPVKNDKISNE